MKRTLIDQAKHLLTLIGRSLSARQVRQLQASLNYIRTGLWVRNHGYNLQQRVNGRERVWDVAADRLGNRQVLYIEIGVAAGESMRYWSARLRHPGCCLHGFDSFEGLPHGGGPWIRQQFDQKGLPPRVDDPRVRFFKGWFEQTIPLYSPPPHEVLLLNMDADLYSSTLYVLRQLRPLLRGGSLLYFDEMNHPEHEPQAFDEFMSETGMRFKLICADRSLAHQLFECVELN
ncbi:MAG: TylF/MycF/NovP-related O-methyltransferase [Bryobacteraceae bacterium]